MKNILVLTDFSDRAKVAADYAMNLAITCQANIVLCHALEITEQLAYPLADHMTLRNKTMKRLRDLGSELAEIHSELYESSDYIPVMSFINDLDMLPEVIEKLVDQKHIDLIVVGAHKSTVFSRFLAGSHTNSIVDCSKCPVLVVPQGFNFQNLSNIVYATDLTFDNSRVISFLKELANPFGSEISINHISDLDLPLTTTEQSFELSIIDHIDTESFSKVSYHSVKGESVSKTLLEKSDSDNVDIMVLVHKRYDFFEGILHTSISKQLAHSIKVPLLVLPYSFSISNEDLVKN